MDKIIELLSDAFVAVIMNGLILGIFFFCLLEVMK